MPVLLPLNVSTDAIEKTIHDWLDYLSDEDYESAYQMIVHDHSIVGKVWYDLPLNGEWSDLTATFNILKSESHIVLELNEIHIF